MKACILSFGEKLLNVFKQEIKKGGGFEALPASAGSAAREDPGGDDGRGSSLTKCELLAAVCVLKIW